MYQVVHVPDGTVAVEGRSSVTGTSTTSRERLLSAVIEYVADHGVADLSLRRLAAAIGTSHRMLIYHFGSKDELLIEVIRAVEDQQRQTLAEFDLDPSLAPDEVTRRMWHHLSDPALWPNERLFFEVYGQALQARPHTANFLDDIVESWLAPATAMRLEQGVPPDLAPAQARLDLAMTRGLLLDLLATGDRAGVDDAVDRFIALFEAWRAVEENGRARAVRTVTQLIESDTDPDAVFALIADPRLIPTWAPRLGSTVTGDLESGWRITKHGEDFPLRVVATRDARTADYVREITPGRDECAYLRALPRPDGGSIITMVLTLGSDDDPTVVATSLHEQLTALATLAEEH